MKQCLNCNKEYTPDKSIQIKERTGKLRGLEGKFCSRSCSASYTNKLKQKPKLPNEICAYCNEPFYIQKSHRQNSKSGLFFCCRSHKDLAQRIGGIKEIMPNHYGKDSGNCYREFALRRLDHKCHLCNYNEHKEILDIHHIDNDRTNNHISNLIVLCKNCHGLVHHNLATI
jgi:hypothetical protein